MRIKFTETVQYETSGPGTGPVYKAGETHDFRDDIAHRWLRRNVAVKAAPKLVAEKPLAAPMLAPVSRFDEPEKAADQIDTGKAEAIDELPERPAALSAPVETRPARKPKRG